MRRRAERWTLLLGLAGACAACGRGRVSPQLAAARAVTAKAAEGPLQELEPESVRAAQGLLARAEAQIDGSEAEEHFAYLAERRARVAISNAQRLLLERERRRDVGSPTGAPIDLEIELEIE